MSDRPQRTVRAEDPVPSSISVVAGRKDVQDTDQPIAHASFRVTSTLRPETRAGEAVASGGPRMGSTWKLVHDPSTIELGGRGEIVLYGPVAQLVRAADS
jgi:hypothetical protein